jgi:hypothetical protein
MTTHAFATETGSETIERYAREHPGVVTLARLGWVAKGIVYLLLGVLAIPIAQEGRGQDDSGTGESQASQTGAVARIADSMFGELALWLIAVGLMLYVLWRLVSIALPAENSAKAWLTRIGYLISALVYTAVAWTAVSYARAGGSSGQGGSEDSRIERWTAEWLQKTAGQWLIGTVGVIVVAVGLAFIYRGLTADFRKELEPRGVGPVSYDAIVTLGRIGWVGRGVMMGIVGWFLTRAAIKFRPDEASGIDGALREATATGWGRGLVWVVAIGLAVYGVYCIISAPRERLRGSD